MGKRYFEFSEGSSNKFWEVWCEGASLYTRYGKIGAQGQLTIKELGSAGDAKAAHDKLVAEKTKKGYVEKGGKPNGKAAAKAKPNGKAAAAPADTEIIEIPDGATRLELIEGTSRKFYLLKVDGKKLSITYGRIGTDGTTETTKFKDDYSPRRQMHKLIEDKQKKGYVRVMPGPRIAFDAGARDEALEAQILKDPSDDNLAVYADWLQEQGDVRGELGALQAQVAKKPKDKKLANQADKLLWEHRARLYGPLAPYVAKDKDERSREIAVDATWRHGWIDKLALGAVSGWRSGDEDMPKVRDVAELVHLLPKTTSARFVRELVLTRAVAEDQFDFGAAVDALVRVLPSLPALRRLTIGEFSSEDCELSWSSMGKLDKLWPVARELEYVKLRAGSMELGKIALPACRELRIETGGFARKNLQAITAASWPRLETLSLWFGQEDYGCNCRPQDVTPILDGKPFPKLRHLGLANAEWGDELAELMVKAKILRQLETLDISMSHLTLEGIRTYADASALGHLASLDVSRCLLDGEAEKLAKKLAKQVNVERQEDADWYTEEDMRYARVGE